MDADMGPSCCMCGWFGEGLARLHPVLLVRFRAVQRLDSKGRTTGCRTAEFDNASALARTVVEGVHVDHASTVVVSVRPSARAPSRCGRRSSGYGRGAGRRRRQVLKACTAPLFIKADPPRTQCRHQDPLATRIAFAFHGPESLIALALLALGSHPPRLPRPKLTHTYSRRARYGRVLEWSGSPPRRVCRALISVARESESVSCPP